MPSREPFKENSYYHIYSRGLNKQTIFHNKRDYKRFLIHLEIFSKETQQIKIISYSLLPNHFHFVIHNIEEGFFISKFMCKLLGAYANFYNIKYKKAKGISLFESRFKSKIIKNEIYLNQCLYYVNLNAIKHGIVEKIIDRPYTSYHEISRTFQTISNKIIHSDESFLYDIEY